MSFKRLWKSKVEHTMRKHLDTRQGTRPHALLLWRSPPAPVHAQQREGWGFRRMCWGSSGTSQVNVWGPYSRDNSCASLPRSTRVPVGKRWLGWHRPRLCPSSPCCPEGAKVGVGGGGLAGKSWSHLLASQTEGWDFIITASPDHSPGPGAFNQGWLGGGGG